MTSQGLIMLYDDRARLYTLPLRVESDFQKPWWRCGRHLPWLQSRCRAEDFRLRMLNQMILWWVIVQWWKNKTDTQKPRLPHVGNADFHMSDLQTTGGDDWIFNSKGLAEDQLKIGRWNGLDIALRHGRRNAFRFLEGVGFQFVSTYLPTKFQASCRRSLRRGPGYTYSFHDHATSILTKPPTNWISTKSLNSCLSLTQYQN